MGLSGAILLSRQGLRPHGGLGWVKKTLEAIDWFKEHEITLVDSVGTPTWELVAAAGSMKGCRTRLVIPIEFGEDFDETKAIWEKELNLNDVMTEFIECPPPKTRQDKAAQMRLRDQMVCNEADLLFPISIRPGGTLEKLLRAQEKASKQIDDDFLVPYEPGAEKFAYTLDPSEASPQIQSIGSDYVIHWTRASNGAWPTERVIDYYHALIESDSYPRSAFAGLMNIVSSGRIVASSKHIRDGAATVAFSLQPPVEMIPLMRWRARYRQMSFEPYGIGIPVEMAEDLGIRRVKYIDSTGDPERKKDNIVRWLTQSSGKRSDWSVEKEYRHRGDLDLSDIPPEKLLLICRTEDEAAEARRVTGLRAIPFTNG
jgi:hypothetical protein